VVATLRLGSPCLMDHTDPILVCQLAHGGISVPVDAECIEQTRQAGNVADFHGEDRSVELRAEAAPSMPNRSTKWSIGRAMVVNGVSGLRSKKAAAPSSVQTQRFRRVTRWIPFPAQDPEIAPRRMAGEWRMSRRIQRHEITPSGNGCTPRDSRALLLGSR